MAVADARKTIVESGKEADFHAKIHSLTALSIARTLKSERKKQMSEQQKKSLQRRWDDLRPSKTMLFWACAGSVVVALTVGFTWGGWVTGGSARAMATAAGEQARSELASVICAEKFMAGADAQARLSELKAIDSSYRQRQFIDDGGWAIMPGEQKGTRETAELCAKALDTLELDTAAAAKQAKAEPVSSAQ